MDVIKLSLPEGDQLEFQIAIVDEPAIESSFMAFNKEARFQFKEVDKAERKLMGYFMIADMEIPRYDAKRGYYNVVFTKESIDKIVENFSKNGLNKNMNEMHQTGKLSEGVYVLNHWQLDSKKGIGVPEGFTTEADGSWFGIVKCDNEEIYQKALAGEYSGFSIEGRFIEEAVDKYFKEKSTEDQSKNLYNKLTNMSTKAIELFSAFLDKFSEVEKKEQEHKFEEALLADGVTKVTIEPAIEAGAAINVIAEDGTAIPAPVGEHTLQDGRIVVVEVEGIVASIKEMEEETEELAEETPAEDPKKSEAVKRLIERIEKVSEFENQIAELKKENDLLHKENDAIKTQFSEFVKASEERFAKLEGEPAKEPVQKPAKVFDFGKKETSKYKFLD